MKKKNNRTVAEKIANVNALWDNEEKFTFIMPEREMYFCPGGECNCDSDDHRQLVYSVYLNGSSDWLAWELEMME